jgi:hypothetical protein
LRKVEGRMRRMDEEGGDVMDESDDVDAEDE